MTHPTQDELVSLLYGEAAPEARLTLEAHLQSCRTCAAQMEAWKRAQTALDSWKLPSAKQPRTPARNIVPWAAAAAIAVLAGAGGMRLSALSSEVNSLRAEVQRQRSQPAAVGDTSLAEFARKQDERRAADQRAVLAALHQFQERQAEAYAGLRRELETVAVLTEAGLQAAQNEIAKTATPATDSNKTQKDL